MNTFFALYSCVLLAFSGLIKSQTLQFDQPNNKTVHEPGFICLISWHFDRIGPRKFTHVDLFLMEFIYDQFSIVQPIAHEVDIDNAEKFEWEIPLHGILNGQYAIGAMALGHDYHSYSDHFWILRDYYLPPRTIKTTINPYKTA